MMRPMRTIAFLELSKGYSRYGKDVTGAGLEVKRRNSVSYTIMLNESLNICDGAESGCVAFDTSSYDCLTFNTLEARLSS